MKILIDFAALALLYVFVLFKRWKSRGKDVLLTHTLLYLYLAGVLYFTLAPVIASLPFVWNHPYQPMNLEPFSDVLAGRGDYIRQIALNVIMTAPFGFLFPLLLPRKAPRSFAKTVFCCFLMSLGIELLQPLLHGTRSSDITDLITNTAGAALGYGCHILFRPIVFWLLDRLKARD